MTFTRRRVSPKVRSMEIGGGSLVRTNRDVAVGAGQRRLRAHVAGARIRRMYGVSATPMTLADERGNTALLETIDNRWAQPLRPLDHDRHGRHGGKRLELRFQNEHLVAVRDGDIVASVPDLIIVLDGETGAPITTEELRYGYRVAVVATTCDPRWLTRAGLALVRPRYFGYEIDYVLVEERLGVGGR